MATLVVCAAIPVALLIGFTVGQAAAGPARPGWHYAIDFHDVFWKGGRQVWYGHSPYPTPAALARVPAGHVRNFVYPAPLALVFAPLGALPYPLAAGLFTLELVAALALSLRLLGVRDGRCYGVALLSAPILTSVSLGTITPLLVLGLAVLWRYRDRRYIAAAAASGLIIAKPLLWPLLLWLMVTRRLSAAALSGTLILSVTLAAWWAIGFAGFAQYPDLLRTLTRLEYGLSYSLAALAHAWGLGRPAAEATGLAAGLLVIVVATAFAKEPARDRKLLVAALGASLLATPVLWLHYFALLIVPIALVAPRLSPLWFVPVALWLAPVQHPDGAEWRIVLGLGVFSAVLGSCLVRRLTLGRPISANPPGAVTITHV